MSEFWNDVRMPITTILLAAGFIGVPLLRLEQAADWGWKAFYFSWMLSGVWVTAAALQATIEHEIKKHTRKEDK